MRTKRASETISEPAMEIAEELSSPGTYGRMMSRRAAATAELWTRLQSSAGVWSVT